MSNYLKTLKLITIIVVFVSSCSDNQNDLSHDTNQLRSIFLKDKDYNHVKKDYLSLENSVKTDLWIEKLNQLQNSNLPENHKNLIQELTIELKSGNSNETKLRSLAIELAKITPEHDFLMMFGALEDYSPKIDGGFHDDFISIELQENLQSIGSFNEKAKTNLTGKALPECNCSWTCDWYNNGYSDTNCNETTTGCGFLWLQSCDEKV